MTPETIALGIAALAVLLALIAAVVAVRAMSRATEALDKLTQHQLNTLGSPARPSVPRAPQVERRERDLGPPPGTPERRGAHSTEGRARRRDAGDPQWQVGQVESPTAVRPPVRTGLPPVPVPAGGSDDRTRALRLPPPGQIGDGRGV